jgi:hypothetical protein
MLAATAPIMKVIVVNNIVKTVCDEKECREGSDGSSEDGG